MIANIYWFMALIINNSIFYNPFIKNDRKLISYSNSWHIIRKNIKQHVYGITMNISIKINQ